MNKESFFLIFSAVGVFPVALVYGAYPSISLPFFYDIEITNNNLANVFRAIMGIYIAFNIFWIIFIIFFIVKLSWIYKNTY